MRFGIGKNKINFIKTTNSSFNRHSIEEKYTRLKKKFLVIIILFIAFISATAYYLYLNYDYLAFKHLISQNYIYTDTLDEIYSERLKDTNYKSYYSAFDDVVISIVTKYIREKNNDVYTYLYLPDQLKKNAELDLEEASESVVRELYPDLVYFKLTNFSVHTEKFLNEHKDELKNYQNIVIDLRQNRGGDIAVLNKIADLFLPNDAVISKDLTRSRLFSVTNKASGKAFFQFDKIIILQDKNTASSSEGLIAALKENLPNVTLVGDTTYGKGIGQITFPLKNGYAVKATVLRWYTPNGNSIHQEGIVPDYFYDKDDIIDFSVMLINEGK